MTLTESVRALHAANLAILDAQDAYSRAHAVVVEAAKAINPDAPQRQVVVIGKTAYYIDPPGTHGNSWTNGWSVTFGSPPEVVEVEA